MNEQTNQTGHGHESFWKKSQFQGEEALILRQNIGIFFYLVPTSFCIPPKKEMKKMRMFTSKLPGHRRRFVDPSLLGDYAWKWKQSAGFRA